MPDSLPDAVIVVRAGLERIGDHELCEIASRLICDTPDLRRMWGSLERQSRNTDDLWVYMFLEAAKYASTLPPYHHLSPKKRRQLVNKIERQCALVSTLFEDNELDFHIVHNKGKIFDGFFIYEEFSYSNQARIDDDGAHKLPFTRLLKGAAEYATERILEDPIPGKGGENAIAVRCARLIGAQNRRVYGTALNGVVAIATNTLFGTEYQESDIANFLNR